MKCSIEGCWREATLRPVVLVSAIGHGPPIRDTPHTLEFEIGLRSCNEHASERDEVSDFFDENAMARLDSVIAQGNWVPLNWMDSQLLWVSIKEEGLGIHAPS